MSKFFAVLFDTLLEIKDRKIIYLYSIITVILILVFIILPGSIELNGQSLFRRGMLDGDLAAEILSRFFDGFFGFMIFLMVFGSAGLVPSYLRKGRAELNLSKPINRIRLLSYKFTSVYLVMIAILGITTTMIWLTICLRSGLFYGVYFYGLILAFLQFLIVYGIVFFLGLLTNSTAVAIMGYFIIRIGAGLLSSREVIYPLLGESAWKTILDVIYHILPKIGEMSANFISLMTGQGLGDTYPVWSSLIFAVALYTVALLFFIRRDY